MTKYQQKKRMLAIQPDCYHCSVPMIVSQKSRHQKSAIIRDGHLVCFQCNRIISKKMDIENLPTWPRWRKKLDEATGIVTCIKKTKGWINKFIYFKIRGGKPSGRYIVLK